MQFTIRGEIRAIRAVIRHHGKPLEAGEKLTPVELTERRQYFGRLFQSYMRRLEEVVGEARAMEPDRPLAIAIRECMPTARALNSLYSETLRAWPPSRVEGDWRTYTKAVRDVHTRLWAMLDQHETRLVPLLPRRMLTAVSTNPAPRPVRSTAPSSPAPRDTIAANCSASAPSGFRSG